MAPFFIAAPDTTSLAPGSLETQLQPHRADHLVVVSPVVVGGVVAEIKPRDAAGQCPLPPSLAEVQRDRSLRTDLREAEGVVLAGRVLVVVMKAQSD